MAAQRPTVGLAVNTSDRRPSTEGRRATGALKVAGWASAGLLALQFGWLMVMPPATGIDEFDHLYRASAVSLGHWQPGTYDVPSSLARGAMVPVRADIVEAAGPACARLPYTKPFNCRPYQHLRKGIVKVASGVDNYNPAYYAVVGTLARPWEGNAAVYAMRLVSIAGCALMFGLAVFLTASWARTRWPVALTLLSCLPTTVYSSSIATPNGPQMVSGILVWASLAALLRGARSTRGPAYAGLMVGAGVMANTHTLGLLWLALITCSWAIYAGLSTTVALVRPRDRRELVVVIGAVVAVAFQLWWMIYAKPNSRPEGGFPGSPWGRIAEGVILWPLQAIAAFPYRNEHASLAVYGITLAILSCLAVVAGRALRGQRRLGLAVGATFLLSVAVPVAITYAGFHRFGTSWQGRYGMPYSVGLFVLAALALDEPAAALRKLWWWLTATCWGAAHVIGLTGVLAKQRADHVLIAATSWWAPPSWLLIVIGLMATTAWLRCLELTPPTTAMPQRDPRGGNETAELLPRVR